MALKKYEVRSTEYVAASSHHTVIADFRLQTLLGNVLFFKSVFRNLKSPSIIGIAVLRTHYSVFAQIVGRILSPSLPSTVVETRWKLAGRFYRTKFLFPAPSVEGLDGSISHAWRWGDGFNHFREPDATVNQNSCLDDLAYF